ncbi:hypothetical protein DYB26_009921 [Aphanomyces astaci]|uniref:Uncharacterized protein n=1 Tax=Aphanomyces astaci TaxID=112090 RepID=A0A397DJ04_APHAT|nr:hypothetical protein DYB38_001759 [Aphanomyces astaci]RHZ41174.1 hypothetical protein DYB26_009921 [Aphanomyces astaci]
MMAGVPRSSPPPLPPPPRGLIGNLGLLSYALMQLAGQAVDVTVITPCAELISTSVMNPNVNSNTLNGSSDKAHHIPVNGDDSMKKTRRHQSRKAALEASMLRKLGVREPMDEVEETLELPTDMTGVRGTANNELLSRAFESFDEGQEHEDQVARDDNGEEDGEQWHVEQTHPTLRRRHHRQRRRLDDVVATYETKLSLLRKQLHAMNAEREASKNDLKKWEEYGQKSQASYKNLASKHATLLRANETLTTDLRTAKQSIVALEATVTRAHADTATVQFLNTNDMNALESDLANPAMVISALKKANRFRMLQYEKVVQKLHVAKEQVNRLTEVAMQGGDAASPRRKKAHKRPHTAGPLPAFDVRQSSMLASFHDVMPAAPGASNAQTVVTQGRQLHWMHREDLKPREIAHPISSRLVLHPRDMHKENHSLHDRSTKPKKAAPAHTNPITN